MTLTRDKAKDMHWNHRLLGEREGPTGMLWHLVQATIADSAFEGRDKAV